MDGWATVPEVRFVGASTGAGSLPLRDSWSQQRSPAGGSRLALVDRPARLPQQHCCV